MIRVGDIKIVVDEMGGIGGMFQRHAITKDKKAYLINPLDLDKAELDDEIEAVYIGDVNELEIEKVKTSHKIVMDAIEVFVYEIDEETMRLKYKGMLNFDRLPSIATEVIELASSFRKNRADATILQNTSRRSTEINYKSSEVSRRTLGE